MAGTSKIVSPKTSLLDAVQLAKALTLGETLEMRGNVPLETAALVARALPQGTNLTFGEDVPVRVVRRIVRHLNSGACVRESSGECQARIISDIVEEGNRAVLWVDRDTSQQEVVRCAALFPKDSYLVIDHSAQLNVACAPAGALRNGARLFLHLDCPLVVTVVVAGSLRAGAALELHPDTTRDVASAAISALMPDVYLRLSSERFSPGKKQREARRWRLPCDQAQLEEVESQAAAGDTIAQVKLGYCLQHGLGARRDLPRAVYLYRCAASKGDPAGQVHCAHCNHRIGANIEALRYFRLAASQGFSPAQVLLAHCYQLGVGTRQNLQEAVVWYGEAAAQGDAFGLANLAYSHEHGIGTPVSLTLARLNYFLARKRGWCDGDNSAVQQQETHVSQVVQ